MNSPLDSRTEDTHSQDLAPGDSELPGPKYGRKRWTLGSSSTLVDGGEPEPLWVGAAWIVVPTAVAFAVIALLVST